MPELRVKNPAKANLAEMIHTTGTMHILSERGDQRITWNARDTDEVLAARKTFEDLTAKGFVAWDVTEGGGKGERMRRFDPDAQKVILAPPQAGG